MTAISMTRAACAKGEVILSVKDLKVHFPVRVGGFLTADYRPLKAVDGVSFDLRAGETLGVVGESGCGKSTLGRAILRLVNITGGEVVWLGRNLADLGAKEMRDQRRNMQIIFQDPLASLNPRMTVGDIIGEPLATFRADLSKAEKAKMISEMLAKVGLSPQMVNRYPHEFSGGQCQRIGIARAMILQPSLIICDEPVSALDVSIQAQIINLLMKLQEEFGLTLIFISHDLSIVRHISHRVMVLYLGKVMEISAREALYRKPLHPYTRTLLSAVPVPDPDKERSRRLVAVKDDLPSPLNPPKGCVFHTRCLFASDICKQQAPVLEVAEAGHQVACHHWRDMAPEAGGSPQIRTI
jgi:oligopeptide transport system ATP-binding protein